MSNKLIIIGAGGHSKVIISTALAMKETIFGLLDDNADLQNKTLAGFPILGKIDTLYKYNQTKLICGLGNNHKRKTIGASHTHLQWETLVHPTAYVDPTAIIGKGTVVFAGAIIQPDTVIGSHCIINTAVSVDHDCIIEDYSHLAPGVHLAGGVKVGKGCFLGVGTVVIPQIKLGEWAIIGAGSVVINDIASYKTVMGIPAKEKNDA